MSEGLRLEHGGLPPRASWQPFKLFRRGHHVVVFAFQQPETSKRKPGFLRAGSGHRSLQVLSCLLVPALLQGIETCLQWRCGSR